MTSPSEPTPPVSPIGYEPPDESRAASSAPTEPELEQESPQARVLDYSPAPQRHDAYAALRNRSFLIYAGGWLISVLGHHMLSNALGWEIYDRTGRKELLGYVAGIQVIPLLALALPAGRWADMVDRRRIIGLSSLGACLCSAALATLSYRPGWIGAMFVLLGLNASFLVIGRPARSSLLPLIVPRELFANAVTWNSSLFQLSGMFGPALGGMVMAWSLARYGSVWVAYAIDSVCGLVFAMLIFTVRLRPLGPDLAAAPDRSVLAGFRFVWRTRIILATMALDLFAVLLGGAAWLLPVFAKDILQVGPSGQGWLRGAEAVGAFTMALVLAHLPPMRRAGRTMLLSVAGFGVATIVFGLSRSFWLSLAMLACIGALDQISVVIRHTLVQLLTPDSMRGRVSAVNNISIGASNELGGLESGLVAAWLGPVGSVVFGGIGTLVTVGTVAALFPGLRRYGSLQGGPTAPIPAPPGAVPLAAAARPAK